jgi:aspartyl-tRNA(Asn)/glutamyl-tRNA(Gln) amidotransferase subunit C
MKITRKEVEHVARLARLELTEVEKELFTSQLDGILAYVDKLNELNTDGIVPTSHAVPMENAFGRICYPLHRVDNALANALTARGIFRVPKARINAVKRK